MYAVLARSLATGEGYRFLNLPGSPNATHFPPLYPLFLAGLWKLFPSFPANVTLFKFANAVLVALAAWLAWRFARRQAGMNPWAAALSGWCVHRLRPGGPARRHGHVGADVPGRAVPGPGGVRTRRVDRESPAMRWLPVPLVAPLRWSER